ncbi:hypothetical protein OB959_23025 [Aeromonas bestiarum]|uniref:Uncharacterized protein n=1 Tax=Aeromonas bestiarum TaxID=105751 RepID=A0AAW7I768_9GAMM|nr:hypothetical protein [Aeromonas bestiarum]MDM5142625.1 hypothetical protein [Aeromonas bestiarum]
MTENTPDFSALQAELEADIATLSAIAQLKLATLHQYQRQLLALREARLPKPKFALCRLLFECRWERRARQKALETISHQELMLVNLRCDEQLPF